MRSNRFVVFPGYNHSDPDSFKGFVCAATVLDRYGVRPNWENLKVVPFNSGDRWHTRQIGDIELRVRDDNDYNELPEPLTEEDLI